MQRGLGCGQAGQAAPQSTGSCVRLSTDGFSLCIYLGQKTVLRWCLWVVPCYILTWAVHDLSECALLSGRPGCFQYQQHTDQTLGLAYSLEVSSQKRKLWVWVRA